MRRHSLPRIVFPALPRKGNPGKRWLDPGLRRDDGGYQANYEPLDWLLVPLWVGLFPQQAEGL